MDERVQKYEQKMTKTLKGFEEELTTIRAGPVSYTHLGAYR